MTDQLDCVVIGAGVIGLAVARALAISGREVIVLESEAHIGMHTSSRNSEVIHAGIYYPKDSLKRELCIRGKEMLYQYCADHDIPHQRIGKLIVAPTAEDAARLEAIRGRAVDNGVSDLRRVDRAEIREMEPNVRCESGLLSPSTGIIDSHAYMLALQADIESSGGMVATNNEVTAIGRGTDGFDIHVGSPGEAVSCKTLINAAGLFASQVSRSMQGIDERAIVDLSFAKGHYFSYQGKSPFQHLVYPLPVDGGLGVHATNDMGGSARFGPDVEWIDAIDYSFDESRSEQFIDAILQYFPGLDASKLSASYTGIRPKLSGSGESPADFLIQDEREHGVRGLVNLYGIESPGLTASLAIADQVSASLVR